MRRSRRQKGRNRRSPGRCASRRHGGFTLTELLVVIAIIGIIITLILIAAADGQRRAQEANTQSLIVKLEGALNDRVDALFQTRPDPTGGDPASANVTMTRGHKYLAAVYTADPALGNVVLSQPARAQVIAWYDFIKREMPDVFFVQNSNPGIHDYPLNFASNAYLADPGINSTSQAQYGHHVQPIGAGAVFLQSTGSFAFFPGEGIYGASYAAAGGIYKNLGYLPTGFDGIDNDGDGEIDNYAEGVGHPPNFSPDANVANKVLTNLSAHKHHTARAEMLYALLVEGTGPLGSAFSRDDFTDAQVKDTDGDGLPEFVDSWDQPLQFFRWPVLYHTDTQKGQVINNWDYSGSTPITQSYELFNPPYLTAFESREVDALDPNNQLLAPAWWLGTQNANYGTAFFQFPGNAVNTTLHGSYGVNAFEYFFHRLTEPYQHTGNVSSYWDRGTPPPFGYRRAFFSKPLILSAGPDQTPGVFLWPEGTAFPDATPFIWTENNAIPFDPALFSGEFIPAGTTIAPGSSSAALREAGKDDITNQNRTLSGGTGGS